MASADRVAVEPNLSSKSITGSMIAQRRAAGSDTTYCTLQVRSSKKPRTSGRFEKEITSSRFGV
jgi:hypothetical protein